MVELTLDVYTCPAIDLPSGGRFSPTTSTLVLGTTEALLVDTQYLPDDVAEVRRRIESSGRTLTTIFITHAHPDHYFGLQRLLEAFPTARAVAASSVAAHAAAALDDDRAHSRGFFAGAAVDNTAVPAALQAGDLWVDGELVRVLELPQADIHPTAALHIPGISAVIAGDAVYNEVHPFLAASGPRDWPRWIDSLDMIAALRPSIVVAGHKQPGLPDTPAALAATRAYLEAFITGVETLPDSRTLVAHMQKLFPDHGNPSALVMSAVTAYRQMKNGS
ncbi:MBL fold metallo-hydrolase [Gordonia sp. NPDC003376]